MPTDPRNPHLPLLVRYVDPSEDARVRHVDKTCSLVAWQAQTACETLRLLNINVGYRVGAGGVVEALIHVPVPCPAVYLECIDMEKRRTIFSLYILWKTLPARVKLNTFVETLPPEVPSDLLTNYVLLREHSMDRRETLAIFHRHNSVTFFVSHPRMNLLFFHWKMKDKGTAEFAGMSYRTYIVIEESTPQTSTLK
ncbi:ORF102 [Ranid herpesvirus 2]|uniref:ORF102 n=1 Tax=Ranid herpesvirus 2 TaxID=389214 RepID=Q14W04_9VIRU|nr:ORF102 [Ranid herpesvirus 2]ABG25696.1 ORF102 [Ranid herpesvirus 2]